MISLWFDPLLAAFVDDYQLFICKMTAESVKHLTREILKIFALAINKRDFFRGSRFYCRRFFRIYYMISKEFGSDFFFTSFALLLVFFDIVWTLLCQKVG